MPSSHDNLSGAFLIRILSTLVSLAVLGYGGYWLKENYPPANQLLAKFIKSAELQVLEPRFSLEQIREKAEKKGALTAAEIRYCPYLLLDVKYCRTAQKTDEAVMLWSLSSGELVMNTKSWECTHGLQDCLVMQANESDVKILRALSKGPLSRQKLSTEAKIAANAFEGALDTCCAKKLIVQKEGDFRIHLDLPRLPTRPVTKTEHPLHYQTSSLQHTLKARYSVSEITALAAALFDDDFTIRSSQEVYLPIYCLTSKTQEGTLSTTYWNALNGKELKGIP